MAGVDGDGIWRGPDEIVSSPERSPVAKTHPRHAVRHHAQPPAARASRRIARLPLCPVTRAKKSAVKRTSASKSAPAKKAAKTKGGTARKTAAKKAARTRARKASWREHGQWTTGVAARLKRRLRRAPHGPHSDYLDRVIDILGFALDARVDLIGEARRGPRRRCPDARLRWPSTDAEQRPGTVRGSVSQRWLVETKNQRSPAGELAVHELLERLAHEPSSTRGLLVTPHGVTAGARRLVSELRIGGIPVFAGDDATLAGIVDAHVTACGDGTAGTGASWSSPGWF